MASELAIIKELNREITPTTDKSEYKIPTAVVFGKGVMENKESFGGRTLNQNAELVDKAIENTRTLQDVWNHSHSQWDWKHITMSFLSPWRNMKQIEAEMSRKRAALNEAKWKHVKNEIRIQKLEEKIHNGISDKWENIEAQVKVAELKEGLVEGTHYIEGAMKDILALNEIYEQLKKQVANFNEEDFEREESKSHLKRSMVQCIRDIRQYGVISKGEQEYMEQIGINPSKMNILLRQYVEQEKENPSWCTSDLIKFVEETTEYLISTEKVDVKRMLSFGFEHDPHTGINYDKKVALLE